MSKGEQSPGNKGTGTALLAKTLHNSAGGSGSTAGRGTRSYMLQLKGASQVVLVVKNPPANAEERRDTGSIPVLGRSLGGENGNPLLYSCLENPMDRGAWWCTVHGVAKCQTRLKRLIMHARRN